jgi:hypothetical protein
MPTILIPGDYTVPILPPPVTITKTILPALQMAPFELLWGVGRTKPINNPATHGIALWEAGEPATCDFRPVPLAGDSDNLYCLRRLAPYLPDFSAMTHLSESEVYTVDKPGNVQALETDWHIQIGKNIWNPGMQLLPGKPWTVRGFDYTAKKWVGLGVAFDGSRLTSGIQFGAEYIISPTSLAFVSVTVAGVTTPVSFVQPVVLSSTSALVFNKAVQLDATGDAKPYILKVGQLTVAYT